MINLLALIHGMGTQLPKMFRRDRKLVSCHLYIANSTQKLDLVESRMVAIFKTEQRFVRLLGFNRNWREVKARLNPELYVFSLISEDALALRCFGNTL